MGRGHLTFAALSCLLILLGCTPSASEESAIAGVPGNAVVSQTPPSDTLLVHPGDRVFFAHDKSELTSKARATLQLWARNLNAYPMVDALIEGHCDERGTREYNLALGERRAGAVRNYLISLGVAPARLKTVSYGKERPAMVGKGEEAWSLNRRAVLIANY
jgi:peptidoglycan-associated lipoprotein